MMEYIPCYSGPAEDWGPLPATRLASRKILIEQNIRQDGQGQHSVYSVGMTYYLHEFKIKWEGFIRALTKDDFTRTI